MRIHLICSWVLFLCLFFACSTASSDSTASGHDFIHHIKNEGDKPDYGDVVKYHYIRRNDNGIYDDSRAKGGSPRLFKIPEIDAKTGVLPEITPITEAMLLMSEGDSLTLEVDFTKLPESKASEIQGESLVFDIQLIEIQTKEDRAKEEKETRALGLASSTLLQRYIAGYNSGELENLERKDGISYIVVKSGNGDTIKNGDMVEVHFNGYILESRQQYLDSYSKIRPYKFKLGAGRVIPAWEKVLPGMSKGDKLIMFVPYTEAYGKAGSPGLGIPEKSDLAIFVEILD